jgi:lysophospholipase L1-like esterase
MTRKISTLLLFFLATTLTAGSCCPNPSPDPLYVAFGDSITAGKDSPTYPHALASLLGLSPGKIANEGKSGESAHSGLERIQELFQECNRYPNAIALLYLEGAAGLIDWIQEEDPLLLWDPLHPSYPLTAQLNERLANIQNNVKSAIQTAQGSVATTYVATYFDLLPWVSPCDAFALPFLLPAHTEIANNYTLLLNERISQAALETGSTLVDINAELGALEGDSSNFFDCNHPSGSGNQLIADVFHDVLAGP